MKTELEKEEEKSAEKWALFGGVLGVLVCVGLATLLASYQRVTFFHAYGEISMGACLILVGCEAYVYIHGEEE